MSIGFWQVALILMIVLIIFGAGKLPRVMGDVAKGIKSFKAGIKDEDETPPVITAEHPAGTTVHGTTAHATTAGPAQPAADATLRKDEAARS
ncbi:MAG TPA: twin-arginine translocase TatA/TatE family subunit [Geminicoccaceae bacterium]|nr:twin-arginine translocase TatA/TatE family subunit [Geminicoccaceae bacterium]